MVIKQVFDTFVWLMIRGNVNPACIPHLGVDNTKEKKVIGTDTTKTKELGK